MKMPTIPFDHLGDVELNVSADVGKCVKSFAEVMRMQAGDVLVLDRKKEAVVDVRVNGQYFIAGELVVANDKYSVRIVEFA